MYTEQPLIQKLQKTIKTKTNNGQKTIILSAAIAALVASARQIAHLFWAMTR